MSAQPGMDAAPGASAAEVIGQLEAEASADEKTKIQKRITRPDTRVIGVRMATVFAIAKAHSRLDPAEIDRLLDSELYEARLAAVSIMDFRVRERGVTDEQRRELHDLWMRRIDRIDSWDLIDRSAPRVVGLWLIDKPRDELFELAHSSTWWHRRAAITATFLIIRSGDTDDALALCELLAADPERFVQTNVGVALREIGRIDRSRLEEFLARRGADLSAEARRTARSAL
ncbi:DNA alkylation repair protein [Micromonospora sp. DT81.3]|uniref:DNA alkylation repair protein n=1 Tax=Actinomycetes TaxID=1760 RepID=UPI003CF2F629